MEKTYLGAARLNPVRIVGVVEVIVGVVVVVTVVIHGRVLGLATVEIVVEGLHIVGVVHIVLGIHGKP